MDSAVNRHEMSRLRWRCRRGLLENDLLIERFFSRHGSTLTAAQARALSALMELGDNELLDLLLGRTEPAPPLASDPVLEVLALMRPRPGMAAAVPTIAIQPSNL
jgi:antitoxin CptB